jgi:hypothetical protein
VIGPVAFIGVAVLLTAAFKRIVVDFSRLGVGEW